MRSSEKNQDRLTERRFIRFAFHAVPEIMQFQLVTKGALALALFGLRKLAQLLMKGGGFSAITSSDLVRILRTWQGWLLIILLMLILFLYTAMEIHAQIINSANIMDGKRTNIPKSFAEGFLALRAFVSPGGIPLIIFISLAVPLTGVGYTISLTRDFHLPNFITSVIFSTPWMMVLYAVGIAAVLWFSVINTYTFPGVVLGHLSVKEAKKRSTEIVRAHKADYIRYFLPLVLIELVASLAAEFLFDNLPAMITARFGFFGRTSHVVVLFLGLAGDIVQILLSMLLASVMILLVTVLFRLYTEEQIALNEKKLEYVRIRPAFQIAAAAAVCVVGAVIMEFFYSDLLRSSDVQVIAHRAGGDLAAENSLEGLVLAAGAGAYGSEIDIQRTADGYYVVNHDANFARLCGDSRKSTDMTLDEVRKLTISNKWNGRTFTAPVATLEEMLDGVAEAGDVLFIELKGSTADEKMADDVVAMLKERNLLGNCVVISLKRNLIAYTETTYPEVNTGLLYYLGYGESAGIVADLLIMEEDVATESNVDNAHRFGKTVVVWTVNGRTSMEKFLDSKADAIITDHVEEALACREELNNRSDTEKIQTFLKNYLP